MSHSKVNQKLEKYFNEISPKKPKYQCPKCNWGNDTGQYICIDCGECLECCTCYEGNNW